MTPLPPGRILEFIWSTDSTDEQRNAERICRPFFVNITELGEKQIQHLRQTGLLSVRDENNFDVCMLYEAHSTYLRKVFGTLPSGFVSLDASRPWMLYWTLHGCDLLGEIPEPATLCGIVETLRSCWVSSKNGYGGFGGGPGQMAHCATTYAAVLALCIVATTDGKEYTEVSELARTFMKDIRVPLLKWYSKLLDINSGGHRMHFDGEVDVRATYTMVAVAKILRLPVDLLAPHNVIEYLKNCQTFEGGFGGEPGAEAHGGYTFCTVAALKLLGKLNDDTVDISSLQSWLVRRQMAYEGGFQGRCNKLVDGCYSFWQGSAIVILASVKDGNLNDDPWISQYGKRKMSEILFEEGMLQRYILLCAQDVNGGLRDKPVKSRDFYHSCYNLSGLSVSQHNGEGVVFGHKSSSLVAETHPCYNVRIERIRALLDYFSEISITAD